MARRYKVADLFCGAGGSSTGIQQFCDSIGIKLDLVAVNHWDIAVESHAANHPKADHFCQDLTRLKPGEAVPGGKLDLLVASPECTHHSNARGGKPRQDQSRASAWVVLEWVNALSVDRVLIENVPEFVSWGPLGADGKPLKRKRGETFKAFITALESSGYRVEYRVLNSADFGAATSRRRLFVQAAKGRRPIAWPQPTHARDPRPGLFGSLPRWRAAREVIDWTLRGESIFGRKRPLSTNTLKRIEAGLRKFGGPAAEPFLVAMNYLRERGNDNRSTIDLNNPLPTVTSQGNRFAILQPLLVDYRGTSADQLAATGRSVDQPHPAITTENHTGVAEFCLQLTHGGRELDPNQPTITTAKGGEIGLVQSFVMRASNGGDDNCRVKSPDEPIGTIHAGGGSFGLVEPFILPHRQFEQMDVDSIQQPHRTITATNGGCNALIVPYNGNGQATHPDNPLPTATTVDRFGLAQFGVDILFRMLQPHELSAAMGFPPGYILKGNKGDQVKQVGNAVEVNQARALAGAMLGAAA
jgi:DNA (cytosine-5)-methyltransferase 1